MSFSGSATKIILNHKQSFASMASSIKPKDLESFQKQLRYSDRVLALCGAGLSAASGLPTFRGVGGLWRSYDAVSLATPQAFAENPGLVWQFYSYRRHMALQAQPNPAHYALAKLARQKKRFLTLSQNVDGRQSVAQITNIQQLISTSRPQPTSRSSSFEALSPPRVPVRRQVHRVLLQSCRVEQLYRSHSTSAGNTKGRTLTSSFRNSNFGSRSHRLLATCHERRRFDASNREGAGHIG